MHIATSRWHRRVPHDEISELKVPKGPVDLIVNMERLTSWCGLLFVLLAPLLAQQRMASVQLEDGQRLEGRVLSLSLTLLEIEVGGELLSVPATRIRSCRFRGPEETLVLAGSKEVAGHSDPAASNAQEIAVDGQPTVEAKVVVGDPGDSNDTREEIEKKLTHANCVSWVRPRNLLSDNGRSQAVPVDLRHSHWHHRIGLLDAAYPWLVPLAPSQWLSLGLLLLVGAGLVIHLSVYVTGIEKAPAGRSMILGGCYVVTGLLQVASVPINDLSVVLMLSLNSALCLFGLVSLFGLPRIGAVVALTVQLGFGLLVFGILELVTALLGAVGVTT